MTFSISLLPSLSLASHFPVGHSLTTPMYKHMNMKIGVPYEEYLILVFLRWDHLTQKNPFEFCSLSSVPTICFSWQLRKIPWFTCHFWKNYIVYQLIQWIKSTDAALSFINHIMAYQCSSSFCFLEITRRTRLFFFFECPCGIPLMLLQLKKNNHRKQLSPSQTQSKKSKHGSVDTDMCRIPCANICWSKSINTGIQAPMLQTRDPHTSSTWAAEKGKKTSYSVNRH